MAIIIIIMKINVYYEFFLNDFDCSHRQYIKEVKGPRRELTLWNMFVQ